MGIRCAIAVNAAKLTGFFCRLAGKQGVTFAGGVALKIYPGLLKELSGQVKKDIFVTCGTNDKTYYLRLRQVLDDPEKYCNFNYLELCPKSVYGSPEGEDQH